MNRIVVFGQSGDFGQAACAFVGDQLAQRLALPLLTASAAERSGLRTDGIGWVAVGAVGAYSEALFRAADTAIWLHYSPLSVAREWVRGLRSRFSASACGERAVRLADLRDSLQHMAWTPYLHRWLQQPALAHLHVCHLRNPGETAFWLRAQEHRLPPRASAQPA